MSSVLHDLVCLSWTLERDLNLRHITMLSSGYAQLHVLEQVSRNKPQGNIDVIN